MKNKKDDVGVMSDRNELPEHLRAILSLVEVNLARQDLEAIKESFEIAHKIKIGGVVSQFCVDAIDKVLNHKPLELIEIISLGYLLADMELKLVEVNKLLGEKNDSDNQPSTRTH